MYNKMNCQKTKNNYFPEIFNTSQYHYLKLSHILQY